MEDIDRLIKEALSEEDSEILDRLQEQSLFEPLMSNFQGKMKWIAMYSFFMILVIFALSIYCLVEFLKAEEIREMLLWGAGMTVGIVMVGMLKMWHWMQMDKNALLREIKRLELQVGLLVKKMNNTP